MTQATAVSVALPQAALTGATCKIMAGNSGKWGTVNGWSTSLPAGDYAITVDSDVRPSGDAPFRVESSVTVQFMSAGAPSATGVRALTAWSGTGAMVSDPKDPWPPPPPPPPVADMAASTFVAKSAISSTLLTLVDAFSGKGAEPAAPPAIHALLIGIDSYQPGPGIDGAIYRNLGGSVRDILAVEAFLLDDMRVPAERIDVLIAPVPGGPGSERTLAPESIPTYRNIVTAWKKIIEAAKPGEIIYVHYSGHGGRAKTLYPAKQTELDETIAPCDINDRTAGRYLRDVEIATLMRMMAERKLIATLVIDSCHSGSVTRGDQVQARQGERDDVAPRAADAAESLVAPAAELEKVARELGQNPQGIADAWQLGAGGAPFTVVAACRADELAYEYAFDGRVRRGALTYFWLEALKRRGGTTTYRSAYRSVFAGVRAVLQKQSPELLGAEERLVLGTGVVAQPASIAVLRVTGDTVELSAGQTNLIAVGTRLAIIPADALPELVALGNMPQAEVIDIDATTSKARIVANRGTIAPGDQAVITAYAPRLRRDVRLLPAAEPAANAALEALRGAIDGDTSKLLAVAGAQGGDFQVAVDDGHFAILDPGGVALRNLRPAIAIDEPDAVRRVTDRLVHLARFHNVLQLRNTDPNAPLANKLSIEILALPPTYQKGDPVDTAVPRAPGPVKDGTWLCVRIRNLSARSLVVALLDLQPDWGISLLTQNLFEPGQVRDLAIRAYLPRGYDDDSDTIKVFGTLEPANYSLLQLPVLDQPFATRGARGATTPLDALMDSMQEPKLATRAIELGRAPTEGWASAEVVIETVKSS